MAGPSKRKLLFGTKILVDLNARKGYRVSPGVNSRAIAKEKPLKARNEQILNLKQMDAATCAALKGQMNEYGECLVLMREKPDDDPDTLIIRKLIYKQPGDSYKPAHHRQPSKTSVEEKPVSKEKDYEYLTIKEAKKFEPHSVDWAVRQIEICISKGYEENLCVGSILGEMRKKGKYAELDTLFDDETPNNFDDQLIEIIKRGKNKYDTRFNEKMEYLKKQGIEETSRRRQMAIQAIYPDYDRMSRPLPPREERRRPLPGGEIPEWLYEEKIADSLHTTEKEQSANVIRYYEMTPAERHKALAALRERNAPYDRRKKTHTTMGQEEQEKKEREQARNYYYLNRYGMTEEEYKKRKRAYS